MRESRPKQARMRPCVVREFARYWSTKAQQPNFHNGTVGGARNLKFNAATQNVKGKVVGCIVTVYNDRTFDFEVKSSPASVLILEAAGKEKGSGVPNKEKVGKITKAQVEKIAKEKMVDLNSQSIEAAMRVIEGTARSMGVTVEG